MRHTAASIQGREGRLAQDASRVRFEKLETRFSVDLLQFRRNFLAV
jgi:hypothetical protein